MHIFTVKKENNCVMMHYRRYKVNWNEDRSYCVSFKQEESISFVTLLGNTNIMQNYISNCSQSVTAYECDKLCNCTVLPMV